MATPQLLCGEPFQLRRLGQYNVAQELGVLKGVEGVQPGVRVALGKEQQMHAGLGVEVADGDDAVVVVEDAGGERGRGDDVDGELVTGGVMGGVGVVEGGGGGAGVVRTLYFCSGLWVWGFGFGGEEFCDC